MRRKKKDIKKDAPHARRSLQQRPNAPVFSYYSKRTPPAQHTAQRQARDTIALPKVWWIRYAPSLLSLAVVVGVMAYLTTLSATPALELLGNNGRLTVAKEASYYSNEIEAYLDDSIFRKSKLTINSSNVSTFVENSYPELDQVVTTVPLFGRNLIVQARPATPALILAGNGGNYVIDSRGKAVMRSQDLASSVRDRLPAIRDDSRNQLELGVQALPTEIVSFVSTLSNQLKTAEVRVETYVLPQVFNEIDAYIAGEKYYVKFNTNLDPFQQAGTYLAARNYLEQENTQPSEYIDARVEERVYYK